MNFKETKPVNPKGNKTWIFIGRIDAESEVPILWPPDVKSWLIGKDPDAGKDWRQEEKGTTMRWLDGTIDSIDMSLSNLWEIVKDREAWHTAVHGVAKILTWLSNRTATTCINLRAPANQKPMHKEEKGIQTYTKVSYQVIEKRITKTLPKNQKIVNKMTASIYLSRINLNVNGQNTSIEYR